VSHSPSLRTFFILWGGQSASILGSQVTTFAITLWAWQTSHQATPLALMLFCSRLGRVVTAAFAGVIVDRYSRKGLMMAGDAIASLSTLVILLLLLSQHLHLWHLYGAGLVNGCFSYIQDLAYGASMSLVVPPQHYTRAAALDSYLTYSGADILAPAIAGALYPHIGLSGILLLDLGTFLLAISTVWAVPIPQPGATADIAESRGWQAFTFGFRYVWQRRGLRAILIFLLTSNLVANVAWAIQPALILARSHDNVAVLASVQAAIGIGGIVGGLGLSLWGGPRRRIHGLLLGNALTEGCSALLGLARTPVAWMGTGFAYGCVAPVVGSANQAIWRAQVDPALQGRVFAARYLLAQLLSPVGLALAGPLADTVFTPALQPQGSLAGVGGGLFGTGQGAGMAVQFTLFSLCGVAISLGSYAYRPLRQMEGGLS